MNRLLSRILSLTTLVLALVACSGSDPGPQTGSKPVIARFTALPTSLSAPGPVTLAWEVIRS